jgi:hypothetical protein
MDVKFLQQIDNNLRLEWVITSMGVLLDEAKSKAPDKDYSDSEKRLNIVRDFQYQYLKTIEENRHLERRYTEAFTKSIHLLDQNEKLKKEIEILKQSINL